MNAVFVNYLTAADLVIFDIHANFKENYKSVIIYIIFSHNTNFMYNIHKTLHYT